MASIVELGEPNEQPGRNSVGGPPYLPAGLARPRCQLCNAELTLFFQVDLPTDHELAGRHFIAFACREHDDVWGGIYTNGEICFDRGQLPADYWKGSGHYHLATYAGELVAGPADGRLVPRPVVVKPDDKPQDEVHFRVGGKAPYFDHLKYICSCGKPMVQLFEIPDNFEFPLAAGQPRQANTPSKTADVLFLGNYLLIMSCSGPCDERAIVVYMVN